MYIAELQLKVKDSPLPNRRAALAALRPEGSIALARPSKNIHKYLIYNLKNRFWRCNLRGGAMSGNVKGLAQRFQMRCTAFWRKR
jgi:hypothetical protein